MKLFMYEAYKVFSKPLIVIAFGVLLILNFSVNFNIPQEVREKQIVYSQIASMEEEEKFEFLERKVNTLTEEYELFEKELEESGSYSYYLDFENYITGDARGDARLYGSVYTEAERTAEYDLYLEEVIASAENLKNFAIFADPDSFDYKNTVKAVEDYKKLEGNEPIIQQSNGLNLVFDNFLAIIFTLILTVMFTVSLVSEDIESGMAWLVKSTKLGRNKTVYSRLTMLIAYTAAVSILIVTCNLLVSNLNLGLGDLNAPIQSVDTFYTSWLNVSIFEYILIHFLFTILGSMFVAVLAYYLCTKLANAMLSYFAVFAFLALEFVAFTFIPQNSYINVFKYVNVFTLMDPKTIFASYVSLNFFTNPVSIILVQGIVYVLGVAALLFLILREVNITRNKLNINIKLKIKIKRKYTYSLFLTEIYKLFIVNKVVFIVLVLLVYAWYTMDSYQTYYDEDDAIYRGYVNEVEGKINADTFGFIEEEEAKFQKMEDTLKDYGDKLEAGEITEEEYSWVSLSLSYWDKHKIVFGSFVDEVESLNRQNKDSIVYKTGYYKFLGDSATGQLLLLNIFGIAFLMFFIAPFYSADNRKGMSKLINATVNGRAVLLRKKIIITVIASTAVCLLSFVPFIVRTLEIYGSWQIHEEIRYILPSVFNVSILAYIIFTLFWYSVIYSAIGVCMLFISKYSKRSITSIIICTLVFVIPSILLFLSSDGVGY